MTHHSRTAMLFGASVVALVFAACGVSSENAPQPITDTISPDTGPTPSVDSSPDTATPTTIGPITSMTATTSSSPDPSQDPTQDPTRPRPGPPPHSTGPSPTNR